MLKTALQMVLDPMKMLGGYLLGRFTEPSTWAAIVGYVAYHQFHTHLPDTLDNAIVNFGVAGATLLAIVLQEGRTSANAVRRDVLKTMALEAMAPTFIPTQTPQAVITAALMQYVGQNVPSWEQSYVDGFVSRVAPVILGALKQAGYAVVPVQQEK